MLIDPIVHVFDQPSATKQIPWAKFIILKFLVRLMYLVLVLTVVSLNKWKGGVER